MHCSASAGCDVIAEDAVTAMLVCMCSHLRLDSASSFSWSRPPSHLQLVQPAAAVWQESPARHTFLLKVRNEAVGRTAHMDLHCLSRPLACS